MEHKSSIAHINCPECGFSFSPEEALQADIRSKIEQEVALRSKQELEAQRKEFQERYQRISEEQERTMAAQQAKVKELEQKALDWQQKEMEIKRREEQIELILKRKLIEQEERLRAETDLIAKEKADVLIREKLLEEKMKFERVAHAEIERVRIEEDLKHKELIKKLEDQNALVSELKRKSEQGSMQLQGEVQELALEAFLSTAYPLDRVDPVAKGAAGADCIQTVLSSSGRVCGKIIYESKRTKHFGGDWIEKLKTDMRASGCDVAILVTQTFPSKDMVRFGLIDGVWICSFAEVKSVSLILRSALLKVGEAISSQENKGSKVQLLYEYLTGTEFRNYVETIVETFSAMRSDLDKEKRAFAKIWGEREKQIEKAVAGTLNMFGAVKGIAGAAVQDIPEIDLLNIGSQGRLIS